MKTQFEPGYPYRFRMLRLGWIVTVVEGEGVEGDPMREVFYIYTEEGDYLGCVDPWQQKQSKEGTLTVGEETTA